MERFPNHPKLSGIVVFHAMCSYGLNNFKDASEFLKESVIAPPKPYAVTDIEMLLARVYDKASEEDADEEMDDSLYKAEQNDINMAQLAKAHYSEGESIKRVAQAHVPFLTPSSSQLLRMPRRRRRRTRQTRRLGTG